MLGEGAVCIIMFREREKRWRMNASLLYFLLCNYSHPAGNEEVTLMGQTCLLAKHRYEQLAQCIGNDARRLAYLGAHRTKLHQVPEPKYKQ